VIIALDYDDTFTADKELWTWFVERAKLNGHEVSFVTFRGEDAIQPTPEWNDDIKEDAAELGIEIVFCNRQQKRHHFQADVWIDDMPEVIPTFKQISMVHEYLEHTGDTKYVRG
jgi:hypothetical protein